jgi:hypothetical protein
MNINGLPNVAQNQASGRLRKLDITANEPAEPEILAPADARNAQAAANREAVGSIEGVLSTEENQAISELFGKLRSGYTFSGAQEKPALPPGSRINFSA